MTSDRDRATDGLGYQGQRGSGGGGGGGGTVLIALSIVMAGLLVGAGIVLAVLLGDNPDPSPPPPSGVGSDPSMSMPSASSVPPGSAAAASSSPHPYVPLWADHNICGHQTRPYGRQDIAIGAQVQDIYDAAVNSGKRSSACIISAEMNAKYEGIGLSYHEFDTIATRDSVFQEAFDLGAGHTRTCKIDDLNNGYGEFDLDGVKGNARCSVGPSIWVAWTDDQSPVITTLWGTDTSQGARNLMGALWSEIAQFDPSPP